MVYRFSWLAGIAAIGLAFWELSMVLRPSPTGTPWQLVILAAILLGAGITWTTIAFRSPAWVVIVANVAAFVILTGLVIAPDTLFFIFPTAGTWAAISEDLTHALDIIQHSVEPARPVPGLMLLIALLFWTLGFLLTAGLLNDRPFVAILTPLIVAVQFAIIDRKPMSLFNIAMFVVVVALALIAIRADERDRGTGRLQRVNASAAPSRRPTPAIAALVTGTILASLVAVAIVGTAVPSDGFIPWRSPSGYGDSYSGSKSYNPFTDIRANIIKQTNDPLFTADIRGDDPSRIRYRTVTLDTFRDGKWASSERFPAYPSDEDPWVDDVHRYRGETVPISAAIRIQGLRQPWMPAPSTPSGTTAELEGDQKSIRVRRVDGSLFLPGDVTYNGMQYTVQADVPRYTTAAIATLARTETGELSPLFRAAQDAGRSIPPAQGSLPETLELEDVDHWTEIPDELGPEVERLALASTVGLTTNFEQALALEYYFRSSGEFVYDTTVPAGFQTDEVGKWLTDPENPFARHGYCEQFATAMALMGRSLGIPSRVVLGFTSGQRIDSTKVQVTDSNSHAWVEMWMPGHGWLTFDPTPRAGYAAQTINEALADELGFSPYDYAEAIPPPLESAADALAADSAQVPGERQEREGFVPGVGGGLDDGGGISIPNWAAWTLGILVIAIVAVGAIPASKWLRRRRRLSRLEEGDITAAWEDITARLADLGDPVNPAATPVEAAGTVDDALVPLAKSLGYSLYGEHPSTTTVIERASNDHARAVKQMSQQYSRGERVMAQFRPTRLIAWWKERMVRRNGRR